MPHSSTDSTTAGTIRDTSTLRKLECISCPLSINHGTEKLRRANITSSSRKDWFFRVGLAVIPDGIYTFFTLVAVPLSASIPKLLHPILALCSSLAMIGLYATISFLHAIIIYGDESNNYEKAKWDSVGYAEVGFQAVLGLCYIGMAVLSCIAVHQWRRSKDKKDHHAMDVELTPSTKESRTSEAI
jgi:hypothetical protein